MEAAPYGGFLTRTVDKENEQKRKLDSQRVAVEFDGKSDVLRPEGIHVRGVDKLATNDIKAYVDYYLNYQQVGETFEPLEDKRSFRIQWIDDNNVNLIFKTHLDAVFGLKGLIDGSMDIESPLDIVGDSMEGLQAQEDIELEGVDTEAPALAPEYVNQLLIEREAKPFTSSLQFRKYLSDQKDANVNDLFQSKKLEKKAEEEEKLQEEGNSVTLFLRMSLRSDQKVQNAAAYSRYYLMHGEPDRSRRPRRERTEQSRGQFQRDEPQSEEGDLFLDKLASLKESRARRDREDDLFADRMREHSPSRRRR